MRYISLARCTVIATIACAAQGLGWAQTAPLAPGQVSGAELQAWLAADGFPVAGINLTNGCHFIAKGSGAARIQSIFCPTMAQPFSVTGEAQVVGNQFCSKFSYPDGSSADRCQDFIKIGDNKYEVRVDGRTLSVLYRLIR